MTDKDQNFQKNLETVRAYVLTYEQYKITKRVTHLENEKMVNLLANHDISHEVRGRLLRVADLRKFILSESDRLHLLNVHDAIVGLGEPSASAESRQNLQKILSLLTDGNVGPLSIQESENKPPTPDSQIVRDAIYGCILHGDHEKFTRHITRNATSVNLAVYGWLSMAEALCMTMEKMCRRALASNFES